MSLMRYGLSIAYGTHVMEDRPFALQKPNRFCWDLKGKFMMIVDEPDGRNFY
jgi:hypothetical protein